MGGKIAKKTNNTQINGDCLPIMLIGVIKYNRYILWMP